MPEFRRIRIANPARRRRKKTVLRAKVQRRASRPSRRRKRNPGLGGGVLTLMSNPRKKKARRRKNPLAKAAKSIRRRRRNPTYQARKRNGSGRRSNPFQVAGLSTTGMLKLALGAGAGAVGTRGITQLILKEKNENLMGYIGNVTVAIALAYAGGKAMGSDVAAGVLAGGLAATVQRAWDEKVSKVLPAAVAAATGVTPATVKGLGDVSYSDDGLGRMGALGQFVNASFPLSTESGPYVATPPALPATAAAASGTVAMPGVPKSVHQSNW